MNRRRFLVAGAVATTALAGCLGGTGRELPSQPTGEWRQRAHDPRNTNAADVTVPGRGTRAWDRGDAQVAPPVFVDGTVFSGGDRITALDARSGEQQWEADLPATVKHAPALGDGLLVVAVERTVRALARTTGDEEWSTTLPGPVDGAVTVSPEHDLVTVPVAGTGLVAFDLRTGERRWHDASPSLRPAAVGDAAVYVTGYAADGDTVIARRLAPSDGARRWEIELDAPDCPPTVAPEGVVLADGGTLALHDTADGARRRSLGTFGDGLTAPPAVADGTAFVASSGGDLVAVSLADGTVRWRTDPLVTDAGVTVGRETVVAAVKDLPESELGGIAAFARSDGRLRWEHRIEGFDVVVTTPPVLADGAVYYVSNESGGVVALGDLPPDE